MVLVAERFLFNLVNFNELDQLEFVEFCAGRAHLSREMLRQGFHQGASVDILFHPHHDMLSSGESRYTGLLPDARASSRSVSLKA